MSNRPKKSAWLLLPLLVLQNYLTFRGHYAGEYGFPWDFPMSYHAFVYYWTTTIGLGYFPEWVPFQAMGYPFWMNLQTGIAYLPLWFFPLLKIPYTVQAATVFQCLHLLVGSLGAYWLARRQQLSQPASFLVAVFYQGFGGFYCHSEHADIVRAYALLPWLLGAVLRMPQRTTEVDLARSVVTPLTSALLISGGYPGTTMAAMFIIGVGVFIQSLRHPQPFRNVVESGLLLSVGFLLAAPQFLPPFLLQDEVARQTQTATMVRAFLPPSYLLTLIQGIDYSRLEIGDIALRSLFIGLPALTLLCLATRQSIQATGLWLALCLLAGVMILGTPVYQLISRLVPPLQLSRFPIADYRPFVVIPLLLLTAQTFDRLESLTKYRLQIGFLLTAIVTGATLYALNISPWNHPKQFYGTLIILICTLVAIHFWRAKKISLYYLAILLALFSVLDANRVLQEELRYWKSPDINKWHQSGTGTDLASPSPLLIERIRHGVNSRPARVLTKHDHNFSFKGYMTGDYMARDYTGGMQLKRQQTIANDPLLFDYATQPSRTDIFPAGSLPDRQAIAQLPKPGIPSSVMLQHYTPEVVRYQVDTDKPIVMLENETYFPGWRAILTNGVTLEPSDCAGFRCWDLPAGHYIMREEFIMPYLRASLGLSMIGIGIWATAIVWAIRKI